MSIPSIDPLPDAPLRNDPDFSAKAAAWVMALHDDFTPQLNAFAAALVAEAQSVISGVASVNGETGILTGYAKTASPALTDPSIVGCILEDVYTITDGAAFEIDPGNGSVQFITLTASRTPAATNFANGESVTLLIADGAAYTITWSTVGVVWAGGVAPTLATSGYTVVVLSKAGDVVRGFSAQSTAS